MDGRNSSGHRVSLLNESEAPAHSRRLIHSNSYSSCCSSGSATSSSSNRLPSLPRSLTSHSHSRSSSYASTPVSSPQTPPLSRSDSSDSRIMQIPSPITPDFAFDPALTQSAQFPSPPFGASKQHLQQQQQQHQGFFPPLSKDGSSMMPYPAMLQPHQHQHQQPATYGYPVPPALAPAQQHQQPEYLQPVTQSPVVAASSVASAEKEHTPKSGSTGKPQSKKNQYPCPMAKQFNCSDYFTTSGHAARHAKKHTGRKDALCPECNKAFTRKDNMEQHRRTHQNGRNASKDGADASSSSPASASARKAKSQPSSNKRPKPSPLRPDASLTPIDPLLPTSPGSSIAFSDAASLSQVGFQSIPSFTQYIEPVPYRYDALPVAGFTTGLDTLAIVATGEDRKRKIDE